MRKIALLVGVLALVACGQADTGVSSSAPAAEPATTASQPSSPPAATASQPTPQPTSMPSPTSAPAATAAPSPTLAATAAAVSPAPAPDQAGQKMSDIARAALARQLGIGADAVMVVAVQAVEWRDSSLGCPRAGMAALQVITPGYKITLEAQGQRYEYHTDRNQRAVRCDQ